MNKKYTLLQQNQLATLKSSEVSGIYLVNNYMNKTLILVRQRNMLIGYVYYKLNNSLSKHWVHDIYEEWDQAFLNKYPLYVNNILNKTLDQIVVGGPSKLLLYQANPDYSGLELYTQIKGLRGYNYYCISKKLAYGRFYKDSTLIGILEAFCQDEIIRFYVLSSKHRNGKELLSWTNNIFPKSENLTNPVSADYLVTNLYHTEQEAILIRDTSKLSFYMFNNENILENILTIKQLARPSSNLGSYKDYLLFGNFTNQKQQDILHLNSSGLHLYQYSSDIKNYTLINHDIRFTNSHGWGLSHSETLKSVDLNGDKKHDIIFTGPQGLESLSYDLVSNSWNRLLNPSSIHPSQRYSRVIAALPASTALIFTSNEYGNVHWNSVELFNESMSYDNNEPIKNQLVKGISLSGTDPIKSLVIPSETFSNLKYDRDILIWSHDWNTETIKEIVREDSGKIDIKIPLINHKLTDYLFIELILSHSGDSFDTRSLVGQGWDLSLRHSYVTLSHQKGMYIEDIEYYLVEGKNVVKLQLINIFDSTLLFEVESDSDRTENHETKIEYHKDTESWIIENEKFKLVYGNDNSRISTNNALRYNLNWPYNRKKGKKIENLQQEVMSWYMVSRFDKQNNKGLYYTYEQDIEYLQSDKKYTKSIRLKNISDSDQLNIGFYYSYKLEHKHEEHDSEDSNGFVMFPINLVDTQYISGYTIETYSYTYTLEFSYENTNKRQTLLSGITQITSSIDNSVIEHIMKLNYEEIMDQIKIIEIQLPFNVKMEFSYDRVIEKGYPLSDNYYTSSYKNEELPVYYDISDENNINIVEGYEYNIISYLNNSTKGIRITFDIYDSKMTHSIIQRQEDMYIIEDINITDYVVIPYRNEFIVYTITQTNKKLYLFRHNKDNGWSNNPEIDCYELSNQIVYNQYNLVIVERDHKLRIIRNENGNYSNHKIPLQVDVSNIAIYSNTIVYLSDSNQLWTCHIGYKKTWSHKMLKNIGLISLADMLKNFGIDDETYKNTKSDIERSFIRLHIINNLVIVQGYEIYNTILSKESHLFLLDKNHDVELEKLIKLEEIDLSNIKVEGNYERYVFTMGYIYEDRLFKVRVIDAIGKDEDAKFEIRYPEEKESLMRHLNQDTDYFRKQVLFNAYMHVETSEDSILYYIENKSDYIMHIVNITESGFSNLESFTKSLENTKEANINRTVYQSKDLNMILRQNPNSKTAELDICIKNSNKDTENYMMKTLYLHDINLFLNFYPLYIAYQETPNSAVLLTFKDGKSIEQEYRFPNERIKLGSTVYNFITSEKRYSGHGLKLVVRPLYTLIRPPGNLAAISQVKTSVDNKTSLRLTKYEYSIYQRKDINRHVLETFVKVIPGGNKDISGYTKNLYIYDSTRSNLSFVRSYYDHKDRLILVTNEKLKNNDEVSDDKADKNTDKVEKSNMTILTDKDSKLTICDFTPYTLDSEMVSYYGFETYENNRIGSSSYWNISGGEVITGGYAFTGDSYLRLNTKAPFNDGKAHIEGTLIPLDQTISYVSSCWLRIDPYISLELHQDVPFLKAVLKTTDDDEIIGFYGRLKARREEWIYLELVINFSIMKEVYEAYYYKNYNTNMLDPYDVHLKFKLTLKIESLDENVIDVDHIRFVPLDNSFDIFVYNNDTGVPTAIIEDNGLVSQTIYDNDIDKELVNIDKYGALRKFTSETDKESLTITDSKLHPKTMFSHITIKPQSGTYEYFSKYSFVQRWYIESSMQSVWQIRKGMLMYNSDQTNVIRANPQMFDKSFSILRFSFYLKTESSLSLIWNDTIIIKLIKTYDAFIKMYLNDNVISNRILSNCELIIGLDKKRLFVFVGGVLLLDKRIQNNNYIPNHHWWSTFHIKAKGQLYIKDLLVMNNPALEIEYHNVFGEQIQLIEYEGEDSVIVTEYLYDQIGRKAITTKPTQVKITIVDDSIFNYYSSFTTNIDTTDSKSVWHTGKLYGIVHDQNLDCEGYAYKQTVYAPNPFNEEYMSGEPGIEFRADGPYAKRFAYSKKVLFLQHLYPEKGGFYQKDEYLPNGSQKTYIHDKNDNKVAIYTEVPSYDSILATYEYDSNNRIKKIVPPVYHEKAGTILGFNITKFNKIRQLKDAYSTHFVYDIQGNLIQKTSPDSGSSVYIYNSANRLSLMATIDKNNNTCQVVYFVYNAYDELASSGYLLELLPVEELKNYANDFSLLDHVEYQSVTYQDNSNYHINTSYASDETRVKYYATKNPINGIFSEASTAMEEEDHITVVEELHYNKYDQITLRVSTIVEQENIDALSVLEKKYTEDRIHRMIYPVTVRGQPLVLEYQYNKLGVVTKIDFINQEENSIAFTYTKNGQLKSEIYFSNHYQQFNRTYSYNPVGYLTQISDPFLTEYLSYTDNGYGQKGFGDGIVMQTAYNSTWIMNSDTDSELFKINYKDFEDRDRVTMSLCLDVLIDKGYISSTWMPIKLYLLNSQDLPLSCLGDMQIKLIKAIGRKLRTSFYGYRYFYGSHQELIKAKYYTQDTQQGAEPLMSDSFHRHIPALTVAQSHDIWRRLVKDGYIIPYQKRDHFVESLGFVSISLFRHSELMSDLTALDDIQNAYFLNILIYAIYAAIGRVNITSDKLTESFVSWNRNGDLKLHSYNYNPKEVSDSKKIGDLLLEKHYILTKYNDTNIINSIFDYKLQSILSPYKDVLPEILKVLTTHYIHKLGSSPFDIEFSDMDANGNQLNFTNGLDKYELEYHLHTNQIDKIRVRSFGLYSTEYLNTYTIKHDVYGNVVSAPHKNIDNIEYNPLTRRPTRISLIDGRVILYYYDAQGERILKRILNPESDLISERRYLRDEEGRVITDQYTQYLPYEFSILTAYIYSLDGKMLGFVRNDNFYTVFTDHLGSIRLVIKDGHVVASYDYMPYGEILRSFSLDYYANLTYLYTGQEYDEETGLYNYHARLYDPAIGRFYQPDPQSQYFSPYKYAGNSPVSFVDPDGEIAVMIACMVVFGLIGGFIGGLAASKTLDVREIKWKRPETYLGIFLGALTGALIPLGFVSSVGVISSSLSGLFRLLPFATEISPIAANVIGTVITSFAGIAGAYVSGSAANNRDYNILNWKMDRPSTYNALFNGFATGSSLIGDIRQVHTFSKSLGNLKSEGSMFTKLFQNSVKNSKVLSRISKIAKVQGRAAKVSSFIAKNPVIFNAGSHAVGAGLAYRKAMLANNNSVYFWEWNYTDPNTIEALMNGYSSGIGWLQASTEIKRGLTKIIKSPKRLIGLTEDMSIASKQTMKNILKNPNHPLYKTVASPIMSYINVFQSTGNHEISSWDFSSFETYEAMLNGVFLGKEAGKIAKSAKKASKAFVSDIKQFVKFRENLIKKNVKQILKHNSLIFKILGRKKPIYMFDQKAYQTDTYSKEPSDVAQKSENYINRGKQIDLFKYKETFCNPTANLERLLIESEIKLVNERKFYVDRELDFLNCKGLEHNKRSSGKGKDCYIPTTPQKSRSEDSITSMFKPELSSLLFLEDLEYKPNYIAEVHKIKPDSGTLEFDNPKGFAQYYRNLLFTMPNAHSVNNEMFIPSMLIGAVSCSKTDQASKVYVKYEKTGTQILGFQKKLNNVFDTCRVKFDSEMGHVNVALRLFSKAKNTRREENEIHNFKNKQEQVSRNEEIIPVDQILRIREVKEHINNIKNNIKDQKLKIDLQFYYLVNDNLYLITQKIEKDINSLAKSTNEDSTYYRVSTLDNYFDEAKKNEITQEFSTIAHIDLSPNSGHIERLNKLNQNILEIYKQINVARILLNDPPKDIFAITDNKRLKINSFKEPEALIHGFIYGLYAFNLKYSNKLHITVEPVCGRGYADLLVHIPNRFSIVYEFKSIGDNGASQGLKQIEDKGYIYSIPIRTYSDNYLITSVDSVDIKSETKIVSAPKIENLENKIAEIFKEIDAQSITQEIVQNRIKENIEKEINHLYYVANPLTRKSSKSNNYISRLILGQMISKETNSYYASEPLSNNQLSSFLINIDNKGNNRKDILLNIIENSEANPKTRDTRSQTFPPITIRTDFEKAKVQDNQNLKPFAVIDIKLNSLSKKGWKRPPEDIGLDTVYFFKGIDITNEHSHKENPASVVTYKRAAFSKIENLFSLDENTGNIFTNRLNEILKNYKEYVNSESDLQALMHGFFLGQASKMNLKIYNELGISNQGRGDLAIVRKFEDTKDEVILLELKFSNTNYNKARDNAKKALKQCNKYVLNLKIITYSSKVNCIAIVLFKNDQNFEVFIEYEFNINIVHTSKQNTPNKIIKQITKKVKNLKYHKLLRSKNIIVPRLVSGVSSMYILQPLFYISKRVKWVGKTFLVNKLNIINYIRSIKTNSIEKSCQKDLINNLYSYTSRNETSRYLAFDIKNRSYSNDHKHQYNNRIYQFEGRNLYDFSTLMDLFFRHKNRTKNFTTSRVFGCHKDTSSKLYIDYSTYSYGLKGMDICINQTSKIL